MDIGPGDSMDDRVARVIAEMEADLTKPLNLASLADVVNLSVSRLVHLFTSETGVPPGRYLRDLRLQRASHLLTETRLIIKEVMAAVGYNDASHFCRDFKRNHGVSPRMYRRMSRQTPGTAAGSGVQASSNIGPQSATSANTTAKSRARRLTRI